jgi:hypothetical protein
MINFSPLQNDVVTDRSMNYCPESALNAKMPLNIDNLLTDLQHREHQNIKLNSKHSLRLHSFTSKQFHVLFNSLFKVLFNFPSRYLFAIGLTQVFSLRWSLPPNLDCILKQSDSLETSITKSITPTGLTPSMD